MKKLLLLSIIFASFTKLYAQIYVNRDWKVSSGNPIGLEWSNSIVSSNNELYHVGNSFINGIGSHILLTKYNNDGTIIWQSNFNSNNSTNDYGVSLIEDSFGNIYVIGASEHVGTSNTDVILLKYNSNGQLVWVSTYDSPYNKNDIPTDLIVDDIGYIYVSVGSEKTVSNVDFLILKFNTDGTLQWDTRYDYNQLMEYPVGIEIDNNGDIFVTGASASSLSNWDYIVTKYDVNGTLINEIRNSVPGIGYDQAFAFKKDEYGNIYITGTSSLDGINYDIKTIKLSNSYIIEWIQTFDHQEKQDVGNAIQVDLDGNVYVGGYVTNGNDIKEFIVLKYDEQGNLVWKHTHGGEDPMSDAFVKAIELNEQNEVYFVGEQTMLSNVKGVIVAKMNSNGDLNWQKTLTQTTNTRPSKIHLASDHSIYVTSLKEGSNSSYETTKYSEFRTDNQVVYNEEGKPAFKAHELIVRFKQNALNIDFIDNNIGSRTSEFGSLDEFVTPYTMSLIDDALKNICKNSESETKNPCGIKATKIFRNLTSDYTKTVNRLGDTIKIPDFWTTLLLVFPTDFSLLQTHQALNSLTDILAYAEPNWIVEKHNGANDPRYNLFQENLHYISNVDEPHINIEEAWEIEPLAGRNFVKCGVMDEGIDFRHEDFGFDGTNLSSSKVVNGWDFVNNQSLMNLSNPDFGHGTPCAGIIGALRNNELGIAGIAGGDFSSDIGNRGVALYGMRVLDGVYGPAVETINYIYDAFVTSAIDDPTLNYAYGLHLSSNSWGLHAGSVIGWSDTNVRLVKEALKFVNRAQVTVIASRGNLGSDLPVYPACTDDDWAISVGGSNNLGLYKSKFDGDGDFFSSSYGRNMDIIAPAISNLVNTTKNTGGYESFYGTSAAAPHVSGVVGLLMSYLNLPYSDYTNLAPEDCERIIELSATDLVNAPLHAIGYDEFSGWGRLNAGKALRLVEKPWNTVYHFGTNSLSSFTTSIQQLSSNQLIHLREAYQNDASTWFSEGSYRVNVYRVNTNVQHDMASNDTIVAYWARPSSSTVLEPIVNDSILPRERVTISLCDTNNCIMHGFIYEVFDLNGNPLGWWPFDTTYASHFEYTVLARNKFAPTSSLTEQIALQNQGIQLYPNPSSNEHWLKINTGGKNKLCVQLFDLQGQWIRTIFDGTSDEAVWQMQTSVHDLAPSIYSYRVMVGDETHFIRFVKL